MELVTTSKRHPAIIETVPFVPDSEGRVSTSKPFIEANTIEVSLDELRNHHIIPVYVKDNEPVI